MKTRASDFGRKLTGWVVTIIAALVLAWLAFKILSGFIQTLMIIALIVVALFALNWASGLRAPRR